MKRLAFLLMLLSAVAFPAMADEPVDVCLKVTGAKADLIAAFQALGLDKEMLARDDAGKLTLVTANHDVATDYWKRPVLVFGTYDAGGNEITPPLFSDRPILRLRFVSEAAKAKARLKLVNAGPLPTGIERTACPTTRKWFGDP